LNRQGGDRGTQYRSAIFTVNDQQAEIAKTVTADVKEQYYPDTKIVTAAQPAGEWFDAEDYHQL
jgi:peptide-methionine (S)-S-oxide reductase